MSSPVMVDCKQTFRRLKPEMHRPTNGLISGSTRSECWKYSGKRAGRDKHNVSVSFADPSSVPAFRLSRLKTGSCGDDARHVQLLTKSRNRVRITSRVIRPLLITARRNRHRQSSKGPRRRSCIRSCGKEAAKSSAGTSERTEIRVQPVVR